MTEKQISELIRYLMEEGCETATVVNLSDTISTLKLKEDVKYLENLLMSFERSGMLTIKYKKEEDLCIELLPKSKFLLKDQKEEDAFQKEINITIPAKKIFLWSFLASLLASSFVAIIAIILVKVL